MLWILLLITALSLPFAENAEARLFRDDTTGGGGGGSTKVGTGIGFVIGMEFRNAYNNVRDAVVYTAPNAAKHI